MREPTITFRPLVGLDAEAIVTWRYPTPFDLYNLEAGSVGSLLQPEHHYYAVVRDAGEMIGFTCFGADARVRGGDYSLPALDMGGGLRPDLTGQGLGSIVVRAAMQFAIGEFRPDRFRATIASFNERAIRTYSKLGYVLQSDFVRTVDRRSFRMLVKEVGVCEQEKRPNPESSVPT